jgi:phosphoribosylglycinamide formyltransferase 1
MGSMQEASEVRKLRLAVLISGSGTNLQALMDRARASELAAEVVVVVSDRADAFGLERAGQAGIPNYVVDYAGYRKLSAEALAGKQFPVDLAALDRAQGILKHPARAARILELSRLVLAEQELIGKLALHRPDVICLAGFMRLVTPYFLSHYNSPEEMRVLNIHPALLPAFPGRHGYEDTFAYGCKWGGVTVHFVDEGEDSGPVIAQAVYPIWPWDDLAAVRKRGLRLEYEVYAQCINWLAAGQIKVFRAPAGRARVEVCDQRYQAVMKDWLERSLS